jgi:hypothetical protein
VGLMPLVRIDLQRRAIAGVNAGPVRGTAA